jgi:hypothetical protein
LEATTIQRPSSSRPIATLDAASADALPIFVAGGRLRHHAVRMAAGALALLLAAWLAALTAGLIGLSPLPKLGFPSGSDRPADPPRSHSAATGRARTHDPISGLSGLKRAASRAAAGAATPSASPNATSPSLAASSSSTAGAVPETTETTGSAGGSGSVADSTSTDTGSTTRSTPTREQSSAPSTTDDRSTTSPRYSADASRQTSSTDVRDTATGR